MANERRFNPPPKQPTDSLGQEIWRLCKGRQMMTCELQMDTRAGPWVDVQLLKNGEILASVRLVDRKGACHIAKSWRKNHVKAGWTE
jgi:hypothetical protein